MCIVCAKALVYNFGLVGWPRSGSNDFCSKIMANWPRIDRNGDGSSPLRGGQGYPSPGFSDRRGDDDAEAGAPRPKGIAKVAGVSQSVREADVPRAPESLTADLEANLAQRCRTSWDDSFI